MGSCKEKLPWSELSNKNILVTGANGMIASRLIEVLMDSSLKKGLNIGVYALCRNKDRAIDCFSKFCSDANFHLLVGDVTKPLKIKVDFSYIIHAASPAHPDAFNSTPVDVLKSNFIGTANCLEYQMNCSKCRFMFVSSSEVYGENVENIPIFSERTLGKVDFTRARACYPEGKRAAETLCFCYEKQYNSDIVIVRPAFIFGRNILADNKRADVYFLRQVLEHKDIVMYSDGSQIRSYLYVDDCVMGMLFALLLGEKGGVYNIGDENCVVTMKEYAQLLAKAGGVKVVFDSSAIPHGKTFLKTTRLVLDTSKLRELGWRPEFTLESGIEDVLRGVPDVDFRK